MGATQRRFVCVLEKQEIIETWLTSVRRNPADTETPTAACAAIGAPSWGSSSVRRIAPSDPVDRFTAPIARPLPDRASESPVFMPVLGCPSATLLPPTTDRHQMRRCRRNKRCCHRDGIGPGSRRSAVSSRPISALLPDFSGCSSAFAGPGASVRTLYTVVTNCQYFSGRVLENCERRVVSRES